MKFKKLKAGELFAFDGELFIKEKARRNEKGHRIGIAWSLYRVMVWRKHVRKMR